MASTRGSRQARGVAPTDRGAGRAAETPARTRDEAGERGHDGPGEKHHASDGLEAVVQGDREAGPRGAGLGHRVASIVRACG